MSARSGNREVLTWRKAIIESNLKPTTRLVLLTLSVHMNDAGESCFPSIETQARETGLSKRAVITHLELAERAGYIERDRVGFAGQRWARNEYRAVYPAELEQPEGGERGAPPSPGKAVNVATEGGERGAPEAVNDVHPNSSSNSPKNSAPAGRRARKGARRPAAVGTGERHWRDPSDGSTKVAWQGERGAPQAASRPRGEAAGTVGPDKPPDIAAAHWAAWQDVRLGLRKEAGAAAFKSWIEPLTLAAVDGSAVRIRAPSGFIRDHVRIHYGDVVRSLVGAAFGAEEVEIVAAPASALAGAA